MTDKELRKLRRHELLELLIVQSKEMAGFKTELDEKTEKLTELGESYERLKGKLDEKDELIEKLKERLDEKDALIGKLKERLDEKDILIKKLKDARWKELESNGIASDIMSKLKTLL